MLKKIEKNSKIKKDYAFLNAFINIKHINYHTYYIKKILSNQNFLGDINQDNYCRKLLINK